MNFKQVFSWTLRKMSICIPIVLAFTLYYDSKIIYIKELNYMRNPHWAYILFVALNLVWQASSARKYFSGYYEILFNLFPTEMFLMLYFAQRHFKITCILATVVVLLLIMTVMGNFKEKEKYKNRKRYKLAKRENYHFFLLITSLLCSFPALLAYGYYGMEGKTYTSSSDNVVTDSIKDEDLFEDTDDPFTKYRSLLLEFTDDSWSQKDSQDKVNLAQQFVDFEAQRLGIQSVPVSAKKLDSITVIAYYDGESREIVADDMFLNEFSGEEFMNTLCEETYHAMEDYVVTNMDWNVKVINTEYFQELRDWKDNYDHYINGGLYHFDEYENQPIEASAKKYAEEEVGRIKDYLDSILAS